MKGEYLKSGRTENFLFLHFFISVISIRKYIDRDMTSNQESRQKEPNHNVRSAMPNIEPLPTIMSDKKQKSTDESDVRRMSHGTTTSSSNINRCIIRTSSSPSVTKQVGSSRFVNVHFYQ